MGKLFTCARRASCVSVSVQTEPPVETIPVETQTLLPAGTPVKAPPSVVAAEFAQRCARAGRATVEVL